MRNRLPQFSAVPLPPVAVAAPVSAAPQDYPSPGMSLTQILVILRSYWRHSAIIALSIILLSFVAIKFLPKVYTATGTLLINSDMKDTLAGQEFPQGNLGNYVATQTELMLSPIVLTPVVDRLHLTEDKSYTAGFGNGSRSALREYVETRLASSLEVETGRGGHLLYLSASNRDPVKAADTVNAVADVYLEQERRRVNDPAGDRAERYSDQLAELKQKATAAQEKVTEFRKQSGVTDVAATNTGTEVQALESLEARLLEAQSVRRGLESKQAGKEAATDEALASGSLQALRAQKSAQEVQLAQIKATLGPKHPKVLELESQMAVTNRALATEVTTLSENVGTSLLRARELEGKLAAAVADQRSKVLHLRELQDEGGKLVLELESAQAVYKRALDGYDQILFASVGNYSNVSFINRALPPMRASKPNKIKLFLVGILAALGIGLVTPIAYELLLNRRLRCVDDIERDFGIPVLASFDSIPAIASGAA